LGCGTPIAHLRQLDTGSGSTYSILEFPHTGSTDAATLSTSPTTIGSVSGYPLSAATSRDGTYVAVAWGNSGGTVSVTLFHNSGTGWAQSLTLSATFSNFDAIHFLSNGNFVVCDSAQDGSTANLDTFTTGGTESAYNAASNFGANYTINDFAVSP
jgi:hypothetical protein